jgi:hypothetical protein
MEKFWEVRNTTTGLIEVEKIQVWPEAQAIIIRWPNGGMVWNRPTGVRLYAPAGRATGYQPIRDVTRMVQFACYGLAVGFTLIGLLAGRRHGR